MYSDGVESEVKDVGKKGVAHDMFVLYMWCLIFYTYKLHLVRLCLVAFNYIC